MDEMKNLVAFMARNLVDDPTSVKVDGFQRGQTVVVRLTLPSDEMGKVIGKQGRIARAMRTLLNIAASRRGLRASLDIND